MTEAEDFEEVMNKIWTDGGLFYDAYHDAQHTARQLFKAKRLCTTSIDGEKATLFVFPDASRARVALHGGLIRIRK